MFMFITSFIVVLFHSLTDCEPLMKANFQFYCRCLYACFSFILFHFNSPSLVDCAFCVFVCTCLYAYWIYLSVCAFFTVSFARFHLSLELKGPACKRCIVVHSFVFFSSSIVLFFHSFLRFVHSLALRFYLAKRLLISCIKMGEEIQSRPKHPNMNTHTSSHPCIMYI